MAPKKQRVGVKKKPAKAARKPATEKRLEAIQPALPKKPVAMKPAAKPTHAKRFTPKDAGRSASQTSTTKSISGGTTGDSDGKGDGKRAKAADDATATAAAKPGPRKPDAKTLNASRTPGSSLRGSSLRGSSLRGSSLRGASLTGGKSSARAVHGGQVAAEPLLDVSAELAAAPPPPPPLTAAKVHALLKKGKRPEIDALKLMATEELWTLYRKAVRVKPIDADWIELLRNVLMELHYPLVKHIAERLLQTLPKSIELDDLVSAGLFGLMDAIRGFDPDRGIKFKTYCTTRIRGSILDQLRSQDWVPRLVRLKASKIEKALHKLQGEYGREPTHAELAAALEMEHGELATEITSSQAKTMFSLSERWDDRDDDSSVEKVEVLVDKNAVDPIHELNRRDVMNHITRSLTYKERFIIEQYYHVGHTMREIGEMLALTESRVCQIHSNVMARLQGLLNQRSESFHA